jgi:uncharacterized phage protein (TIGR01671 family)
MREIKYQAWQQYELHMFQVVGMEWDANVFRKFSKLTLVSLDDSHTIRTVTGAACDNYLLRQFTGLKDKQGKDIYEGDILRVRFGKHTVEVRWNVTGFGFFNLGTQQWQLLYVSDLKQIEVIGNIYETSDVAQQIPQAIS